MGKRNATGYSCVENAAKKIVFSTLIYVLGFFQKNVQSILQMNVSQPVNKAYKVCFHFIISLSILYQKLAKFLWITDHPGSQAVVGKHQDSSTQCRSVASAFSCKEGKDVLCTAFSPFTVKPLVSTHQGC